MSTDAFKGNIKTGTISAKFRSDFSNVDPDLLTASYSDSTGGNCQTDQAVIAPGGSATVTVKPNEDGLLEILVVTGHDGESGRLQVFCNGTIEDDQAVQGSVSWMYTVTK